MTLLDAFRIQVVTLLMMITIHLAMCMISKERNLNMFEGDTTSLGVFIAVWLLFGMLFRYEFQLPITGIYGYFI
jgi:hypothetical protein